MADAPWCTSQLRGSGPDWDHELQHWRCRCPWSSTIWLLLTYLIGRIQMILSFFIFLFFGYFLKKLSTISPTGGETHSLSLSLSSYVTTFVHCSKRPVARAASASIVRRLSKSSLTKLAGRQVATIKVSEEILLKMKGLLCSLLFLDYTIYITMHWWSFFWWLVISWLQIWSNFLFTSPSPASITANHAPEEAFGRFQLGWKQLLAWKWQTSGDALWHTHTHPGENFWGWATSVLKST